MRSSSPLSTPKSKTHSYLYITKQRSKSAINLEEADDEISGFYNQSKDKSPQTKSENSQGQNSNNSRNFQNFKDVLVSRLTNEKPFPMGDKNPLNPNLTKPTDLAQANDKKLDVERSRKNKPLSVKGSPRMRK